MAKTNAELLSAVEDAIEAVALRGQSYTIETATGSRRTFNRANLEELFALKKQLAAADARDTAGGIPIAYGVPQG